METKFQKWLMDNKPEDKMLWKGAFREEYLFWRDRIIPMFNTVKRSKIASLERRKIMLKNKIIAVDFDGTLCENKWPEIGEPNLELINHLKAEKASGAKLILWTCRVDMALEQAIMWCYINYQLQFDMINENLPEVIEEFGSDTRKIFAHEYIDDKMCGRFKLPFVYRNVPFNGFGCSKGITDDIINKLEQVFEFPFYDWQKRYLKGDTLAMPKNGRGNGKTFAYSVRLLLDRYFTAPIDLLDHKRINSLVDKSHSRQYDIFFLRNLIEVNDKLLDAGFVTNTKSTISDSMRAEDENLKTIEHFLTKDDQTMEFKEIQAIVKMQYVLYKQMMKPAYILKN